MGRHPGDYELVIYKGKLHRASLGSGLPKVTGLRYGQKVWPVRYIPPMLGREILRPEHWGLRRVPEKV